MTRILKLAIIVFLKLFKNVKMTHSVAEDVVTVKTENIESNSNMEEVPTEQAENTEVERKTRTQIETKPKNTNAEEESLTINNADKEETEKEKAPEKMKNGNRYNFASAESGASVLQYSDHSKEVHTVLNRNDDKYMMMPSGEPKWFVVQLSEDIMVEQIEMKNLEHYSSSAKKVKFCGAAKWPANKCNFEVQFEADGEKKLQKFKLDKPRWARFIKIEILSFYGSEFFVTLTQFSVFGSTIIEKFHEEMEQISEEVKIAKETIKNKINGAEKAKVAKEKIDEKREEKSTEIELAPDHSTPLRTSCEIFEAAVLLGNISRKTDGERASENDENGRKNLKNDKTLAGDLGENREMKNTGENKATANIKAEKKVGGSEEKNGNEAGKESAPEGVEKSPVNKIKRESDNINVKHDENSPNNQERAKNGSLKPIYSFSSDNSKPDSIFKALLEKIKMIDLAVSVSNDLIENASTDFKSYKEENKISSQQLNFQIATFNKSNLRLTERFEELSKRLLFMENYANLMYNGMILASFTAVISIMTSTIVSVCVCFCRS